MEDGTLDFRGVTQYEITVKSDDRQESEQPGQSRSAVRSFAVG